MKNIIKLLFVFALGLVFIGNVDAAAPKVKLNLYCHPSTTTYNKTVICDASVNILNRAITSITLKSSISSGPASIISSDLMAVGTPISRGYNIELGSVYVKTKGYSGDVIVKLQGTNIKYDGGTVSPVATYEHITVKSNVNTLSSIKVDGVLVPGFNSNTTSYQVSTTKSSAVIGATKTSSKATLTGTGTKSLSCGANAFTLKVTPEYGSSKNYTVKINRKCDTNVYLSGITVSEGKLDPEFVKTTTGYTVKVNKDVKTISITGQKSSSTQKVTGNVNNKVLKYGSNKIELTVTNQTGAKQVYTVNVIKEDNRDKNTFLSSLSLSSGNINFDKNTFEYETKVLNKIEKIEVLAIPEQETSVVTVKGADKLKEGENTISIEVKAESGKKQLYTVKVTRLKVGETLGDNANIKNIIVKGHDLKFEYTKTNYKLILEKENSLDISITMDDPTAIYEIIGNENLKDESVIKIVTKALDGTTKTYTINITKSSYTVYYVLGAILIGLVIAIPTIVYFRSVKGKKVKKDINGYEEGKEYTDTTKERQVMDKNIAKVPNVITDVKEPQVPINQEMKAQEQEPIPTLEVKEPKAPQVPKQEPIPTLEIKEQKEQVPEQETKVPEEEIIPLLEVKEPKEQPKKSFISKKENKGLKLETPLKTPKTNKNQTTDKNGFDTELQDYVPNVEGNKCPHCGRELLGDPKKCPYCKKTIK